MESIKYFFSYSRSDSEFVIRLATDLRQEGFNVWLDQLDIPPGSRWDAAVERALNEAECMFVVLSNTSVKSNNVLDEVSYAIEKGKKVIPLLIHDCEIPFRIARFQRVDFTKNYTTGLQLLTSTLKSGNTKQEETSELTAKEEIPAINNNNLYVSDNTKKKSTTRLAFFASLAVLAVILIFVLGRRKNGKTDTAIRDTSVAKNNDTLHQLPLTSIDTFKLSQNTSPTTSNTPDTSISKPLTNTEAKLPVNTVDKSILISDAKHKVTYKRVNNDIVFYIKSAESPGIKVDVNQNSIIDNNIDRGYEIAGNTKSDICTNYLITNNSTSGCGAAPSGATLSLTGDLYVFTIPVSELKSDAAASSVKLNFSFYNSVTGWTYYPERTEYIDFGKVYKVDIDN